MIRFPLTLPFRAPPIAVLQRPGEPSAVLSPLDLEHAGLRVGKDPDPVPAPLAGAVRAPASFRACHHSIPFDDGLHDLRERKVACERVFDQWQVVQQVRFVPIRTVQAHCRGSAGAGAHERLRRRLVGLGTCVRCRARAAHVKQTPMCAKPRIGRACRRLRMSLSGLWLHHGLRGGCAAREPEAVTGATHLFRCLVWHREGLGCAQSIPPSAGVAPSQQSRAGRPIGETGTDLSESIAQVVARDRGTTSPQVGNGCSAASTRRRQSHSTWDEVDPMRISGGWVGD